MEKYRAGVEQSVYRLTEGWTTEGPEFEFHYGQELYLFHIVQTDSAALPASYTMGTGNLSLGVKRPGCEADQSTTTSAEFKTTRIYTSIPPYVFMA
jgi:hypothetical protein